MAEIGINNSEDFKEILPEISDIQSFTRYLESLTT